MVKFAGLTLTLICSLTFFAVPRSAEACTDEYANNYDESDTESDCIYLLPAFDGDIFSACLYYNGDDSIAYQALQICDPNNATHCFEGAPLSRTDVNEDGVVDDLDTCDVTTGQDVVLQGVPYSAAFTDFSQDPATWDFNVGNAKFVFEMQENWVYTPVAQEALPHYIQRAADGTCSPLITESECVTPDPEVCEEPEPEECEEPEPEECEEPEPEECEEPEPEECDPPAYADCTLPGDIDCNGHLDRRDLELFTKLMCSKPPMYEGVAEKEQRLACWLLMKLFL